MPWVYKVTRDVSPGIHICVVIAQAVSWCFTLLTECDWLSIVALAFVTLWIQIWKSSSFVHLTFGASMSLVPCTFTPIALILIVRTFIHVVLNFLPLNYLIDLVSYQIFFVKIHAGYFALSTSWTSAACYIRIALNLIGLENLINTWVV